MKRLKRKVTFILVCALIIAQMPATYSNATETNAVQETNSEATNNGETEQGNTNETQVINGGSTEENTVEGNTIESTITQTQDTQVEIDGEETKQVETGDNSENTNDTMQVPQTTVDETNLMSNSTSSTVEAVKETADSYSLIIVDGVLTGYTGIPVNLIIPTTVTSIKSKVFDGNKDIQTLTIEGNLTEIGYWAFQNCTNLKSVTIKGSIESMNEPVFYGCTGLVNTEGFIMVGEWLCQYLGSEENVTIPDGVKHIGSSAFDKCNDLGSITIPEGVTSIGSYAFYRCSNLGSITIPEGVTSIEHGSFWECSSLGSITMPEGVTSIGHSAFQGCRSLGSITMPEGVTSIGGYAFYDCSNLGSITIPEGVTSIDYSVFGGCRSLGSITIPEGVTSIEGYAFYDCSSLGSITIPEGVTGIGSFAFDGCNQLVINCEPDSTAAQYAKDNSIATTKVYVNNISLNESNLSLISGRTATLTKTVSPYDAINKKVTWSSSDTNVAIVDSTGVVTAVSGGTTVITAMAQDGSSVTGSCTVNVSVLVQSVSLNTTELSLLPKESTTLTATILPANSTNKNVTWTSSNTNVATVDSAGKVTAVMVGTATITATTEDGNRTASCTINVKKIENVESVSINESTLNLATGQETTLTAKVLPDNAINKNIIWSSSNTNVATVDSIGKVKAVSAGTTTISVKTEDGNKIATCNVNVSILVNAIKLNATKVTLGKKAKIKLKATTSPEDATSANVTWTSSNTNVATVSSGGIVKAIALGTADITATAQDGSNVTNTCKVTVSKNKSYTIKYKLNKGQNADLNPSYYPIKTKLKLQSPTRKGYTFAGWYVENKKITLIDKKATGKITVTAKWKKTSVEKTTIKKAKNNQAGSIAVSFGKVSGAKGYTVYYSTNKKLKNASKIEANSKKKSATITNLEKGTTYYVTVKAYKTDSGGNRVYGKSNKTMKVKIIK